MTRIVKKLAPKRRRLFNEALAESSSSESDKEAEEEEVDSDKEAESDKEEEESASIKEQFSIGQYVVAVYQGGWYVGQVIDKANEDRALPDKQYLYVSYMERVASNLFKWPSKLDKLNTLIEDVMFACQPPLPSTSTSSSRTISYSLSKDDLLKAVVMFEACFHTFFIFQKSFKGDRFVSFFVCVMV